MITEITWTETAWEQWKDAGQRVQNLRAYFGDQLADEHEAELLRTFARVTFAAGPVNIQPDGHGFYITTPHIVIGLVWTPDSDDKLRARLAGVGFHTDDPIPADWPRTGRWSAHS